MSTLTKIFIVLQLVFSLALSVIVIMVVSSTPKYKDQVEAFQKQAIAAIAGAARDQDLMAKQTASLASMQTTIANLNKELAEERGNSSQAKKTLESDKSQQAVDLAQQRALATQTGQMLKALQEQYTTVTEQLNKVRESHLKEVQRAGELARENDRLNQETQQLNRALRRTQEELVKANEQLDSRGAAPGASAAPAGSTVTAGVMNRQPVSINGTVGRIETRDGRTYLTLPLGKRDGVQNGQTVVISRGNTYIGDAEVMNAAVDQSVAAVKILAKGQNVQQGDIGTVNR